MLIPRQRSKWLNISHITMKWSGDFWSNKIILCNYRVEETVENLLLIPAGPGFSCILSLPGLWLDYKGAGIGGEQRSIINAKVTLKHFSGEICQASVGEMILILMTSVDLLYAFIVSYFHAYVNSRQIIGVKSCSQKNIFWIWMKEIILLVK